MPTVTISTELNTTTITTTAVSMEIATEKAETRPAGPTGPTGQKGQTGTRTGLGTRKYNSTTRTRYMIIEWQQSQTTHMNLKSQ